MTKPTKFPSLDAKRPSNPPRAYLDITETPELALVSDNAVHEASFFKFVSCRGCFESVVSDYCPDFETIVLQTSPGVIYRDDLQDHSMRYGQIAIHGMEGGSIWTADSCVSFSHFYVSRELLGEIVRVVMDRDITPDHLPVFTGAIDMDFVSLLEKSSATANSSRQNSTLELDAWAVLIGERLLQRAPAFVNRLQSSKKNGLSDRQVAIVFEWVEENLREENSIKLLASLSGVSPYHFSRSFKLATGKSPHQYVLSRRMAKACELLEKSNASIAQVAYQVGFSSQAHMTDVFKRKLGVTPAQFKNSVST